MRKLVTAVVLAAVAAAAPGPTARASEEHQGIAWLVRYAGVQMATSSASADDPHLHGVFKRVSGEGQRQVRMGERHKKPDSHQRRRYEYAKPVKLRVGDKVVFTTEAALPCEPAMEPIGLTLDMRVEMPGKPWSRWRTWIVEDDRLLDCSEDQQPARPRAGGASSTF